MFSLITFLLCWLDVAAIWDIQFHREQYPGSQSTSNREKGGGKAAFPEQQTSNKDFPLSWKFCGDTAEMLSSLTPNTGPVLTNTWACAARSNMWCETRRCPFIQSTVGFSENNQQLSTARRREEQFFSPPSHRRRRNQIIKCEKRRRKRERGRTFLHGYLPEATCSGVELASELAMVAYSKGPAVWKR